MRKLEIRSPGATSELAIGALEESLGLCFPHYYREFLLLYNGGAPSDENNYIVPEFTVPGGNIEIQYFFSVDNKIFPEFEIYNEILLHGKRLTRGLVPIAMDDFGNLVFLGTSGEDCNRVYFWNHEVRLENPAGMHLIFRDFETFIDRLGSYPGE